MGRLYSVFVCIGCLCVAIEGQFDANIWTDEKDAKGEVVPGITFFHTNPLLTGGKDTLIEWKFGGSGLQDEKTNGVWGLSGELMPKFTAHAIRMNHLKRNNDKQKASELKAASDILADASIIPVSPANPSLAPIPKQEQIPTQGDREVSEIPVVSFKNAKKVPKDKNLEVALSALGISADKLDIPTQPLDDFNSRFRGNFDTTNDLDGATNLKQFDSSTGTAQRNFGLPGFVGSSQTDSGPSGTGISQVTKKTDVQKAFPFSPLAGTKQQSNSKLNMIPVGTFNDLSKIPHMRPVGKFIDLSNSTKKTNSVKVTQDRGSVTGNGVNTFVPSGSSAGLGESFTNQVGQGQSSLSGQPVSLTADGRLKDNYLQSPNSISNEDADIQNLPRGLPNTPSVASNNGNSNDERSRATDVRTVNTSFNKVTSGENTNPGIVDTSSSSKIADQSRSFQKVATTLDPPGEHLHLDALPPRFASQQPENIDGQLFRGIVIPDISSTGISAGSVPVADGNDILQQANFQIESNTRFDQGNNLVSSQNSNNVGQMVISDSQNINDNVLAGTRQSQNIQNSVGNQGVINNNEVVSPLVPGSSQFIRNKQGSVGLEGGVSLTVNRPDNGNKAIPTNALNGNSVTGLQVNSRIPGVQQNQHQIGNMNPTVRTSDNLIVINNQRLASGTEGTGIMTGANSFQGSDQVARINQQPRLTSNGIENNPIGGQFVNTKLSANGFDENQSQEISRLNGGSVHSVASFGTNQMISNTVNQGNTFDQSTNVGNSNLNNKRNQNGQVQVISVGNQDVRGGVSSAAGGSSNQWEQATNWGQTQDQTSWSGNRGEPFNGAAARQNTFNDRRNNVQQTVQVNSNRVGTGNAQIFANNGVGGRTTNLQTQNSLHRPQNNNQLGNGQILNGALNQNALQTGSAVLNEVNGGMRSPVETLNNGQTVTTSNRQHVNSNNILSLQNGQMLQNSQFVNDPNRMSATSASFSNGQSLSSNNLPPNAIQNGIALQNTKLSGISNGNPVPNQIGFSFNDPSLTSNQLPNRPLTSSDINKRLPSVPPKSSEINTRLPNRPLTSNDVNTRLPNGPLTGSGIGTRLPNGPLTSSDINTRLPNGPLTSNDINTRLPNGPLTSSDINSRLPNGPITSSDINTRLPNGPPTSNDINTRLPNGPLTSSDINTRLPNGPLTSSDINTRLPNGPLTSSDINTRLPNGPLTSSDINTRLPNGPLTSSGMNTQLPNGQFTNTEINTQLQNRPFTSNDNQLPNGPRTNINTISNTELNEINSRNRANSVDHLQQSSTGKHVNIPALPNQVVGMNNAVPNTVNNDMVLQNNPNARFPLGISNQIDFGSQTGQQLSVQNGLQTNVNSNLQNTIVSNNIPSQLSAGANNFGQNDRQTRGPVATGDIENQAFNNRQPSNGQGNFPQERNTQRVIQQPGSTKFESGPVGQVGGLRPSNQNLPSLDITGQLPGQSNGQLLTQQMNRSPLSNQQQTRAIQNVNQLSNPNQNPMQTRGFQQRNIQNGGFPNQQTALEQQQLAQRMNTNQRRIMMRNGIPFQQRQPVFQNGMPINNGLGQQFVGPQNNPFGMQAMNGFQQAPQRFSPMQNGMIQGIQPMRMPGNFNQMQQPPFMGPNGPMVPF